MALWHTPPGSTMHSEPSDASSKRSLWGRLADTVFGYDYFISYAWSDGRTYAEGLARALRKSGFECFLDSDEFRVGDDWRKVGNWTLKRTSSLVIVGSPKAAVSEPVLYELETFRRFGNRVVPIDFEGTLDGKDSDARLRKHLPDTIIRLRESLKNLATGPSDDVMRRLRDDFKGIRQSQWRARLLAITTVTFAVIAAVAFWMWREQRRLTVVNIAQKLAAEAINETQRLEHERAALLARQSYLLNRRHRGNVIERADRALRTVLGSTTFNMRFAPDFSLIRSPKTPEIRAVAYGADTDVVVLALEDAVGFARLRDVPLKINPLRSSLKRPAIAMSSDGKRIALTGSEEGILLYEWKNAAWTPQRTLSSMSATATCVAFAPDGKFLVAGTEEGMVFGWDTTRNEREQRIGTYATGRRISAIAISADSASIATADEQDGDVVLWDRATGQHRILLQRARSRSSHSIDFSPDKRWLAAASTSTGSLWIWTMKDLDKPPVEHRLSSPLSVAFTSDGRSLVVGNGTGKVHVWRTEQLNDAPSSSDAHDDEIRAVSALSTDGRFVSGSRDKSLRLWTPYSDVEASFRWLPSGRIVPAGGTIRRDEWVAYNVPSQSGVSRIDEKLQVHRNRGGREQVIRLGVGGESAAFSPTGRFLAVGSTFEDEESGDETRTATVWDLEHPSTSITMEWSTAATTASSGDLRAESLDSGLVELRQKNEPAGSHALLQVPGSRFAPALWFTAGGEYLLGKSKPSERFDLERTLHLQQSSTAALADVVCTRVRRNLTRDEWQRFIGPELKYERTCSNLP